MPGPKVNPKDQDDVYRTQQAEVTRKQLKEEYKRQRDEDVIRRVMEEWR